MFTQGISVLLEPHVLLSEKLESTDFRPFSPTLPYIVEVITSTIKTLNSAMKKTVVASIFASMVFAVPSAFGTAASYSRFDIPLPIEGSSHVPMAYDIPLPIEGSGHVPMFASRDIPLPIEGSSHVPMAYDIPLPIEGSSHVPFAHDIPLPIEGSSHVPLARG